MKHTDCLNQPVDVGDTVVYVRALYRDLVRGTVVKLTPTGFTVEGPPAYGDKPERQFRGKACVCKVPA